VNESAPRFRNFRDFYPFYLGEHQNPVCRRLHVIGSSLIVLLVLLVIARRLPPASLFAIPVFGYGFAWAGHYFFEKNRPATFTWPVWSLMADWVMWKDVLTGKQRW
jgi:hypothetical protein